ncbi:MAG: hypothetical protein M5U26_04510 [Planctomycetota bacterium]|nr:hypothetical protein [Planctomycetota bacterium]
MSTAPPELEARMLERFERLHAVARAVSCQFGSRSPSVAEPKELVQAVRDLREAARSVPGAHLVIVGGLALQELGQARWTEVVDAVVDGEHYRELLEALRAGGFELRSDGGLRHKASGVMLDLLREGAQLKGSALPLPHPRELGPHLGTAGLEGLLRLKLPSRRLQDQADVVALLKPRLACAAELRAAVPEALRERFDALLAQARDELNA